MTAFTWSWTLTLAPCWKSRMTSTSLPQPHAISKSRCFLRASSRSSAAIYSSETEYRECELSCDSKWSQVARMWTTFDIRAISYLQVLKEINERIGRKIPRKIARLVRTAGCTTGAESAQRITTTSRINFASGHTQQHGLPTWQPKQRRSCQRYFCEWR